MTRELAVQFARENIRVNALCPGPVETPLLLSIFGDDPAALERRRIALADRPPREAARDRQRRALPRLRRVVVRDRLDVPRRRRPDRRLRDARVMRICLMIEGQEGVTWEQWLALAPAAEAAGLDGLFRSDHYRSIVRGDPAGSLDAWATLAALAARTERLRLGTMVSPVTFRPASVLAKTVVDRRPHLERPRRARDRRRLVRGRARDVRLPVPDRRASGSTSSTASSPRSRASGPTRRTSGRSRCSSRARRSSSAAARSRAPCARPFAYADEYNTVFPTRRRGARAHAASSTRPRARPAASRSGSR